jgi:hypothetical protein
LKDKNASELIEEKADEILSLENDFLAIIGQESVAVAIASLVLTANTIINTVKNEDKEKGEMLEQLFHVMVGENVQENQD